MVSSLNCCHGRLWRGDTWNHQVENRLGKNSNKDKADAKDRDRDEPEIPNAKTSSAGRARGMRCRQQPA